MQAGTPMRKAAGSIFRRPQPGSKFIAPRLNPAMAFLTPMFERRQVRPLELCEQSQLRFFRNGAGMPLYGSFSNTPRFDRLKIAPQFGAVLSDLVASFATIQLCKQRVCKLAPRDPQQFLQAVYGAEQIVWRCHPPVAFEMDEGNVLRRIKPDSRYRRNAPVVFGPAVAFRVFRQGHNRKGQPPQVCHKPEFPRG